MSTGYSGTPLPRKLGIGPGKRVAFVAAPEGFRQTLGELPEDVTVRPRARGPLDVIVFFTVSRADLERRIAVLQRALDPAGSLWVAWPKRASKVETDMTEDVVREVALPRGVVDTKVAAIDDTWSGLRLVVRVANRAARSKPQPGSQLRWRGPMPPDQAREPGEGEEPAERHLMDVPGARAVVDYARRHGVPRTVARGSYVGASRLVALSIFGCMRLSAVDANYSLTERCDVESRFLELDELTQVEALADEHGKRMVRAARRRGNRCYAVFDGEEIINVSFYAHRATPLVGDLLLCFRTPDWYMYGALTPPAHRGKGLHAVGVLRASLALFDEGVSRLVTVHERTHYNSMVSALRMGWRPCGSLYRIGSGPRTRVGRSVAARREGMMLRRLDPAAR